MKLIQVILIGSVIAAGIGKKRILVSVEQGPTIKTSIIINTLKESGDKALFYFNSKSLVNMSNEKIKSIIAEIHAAKMYVGVFLGGSVSMNKDKFQKMLKSNTEKIGTFLPGKLKPKFFTSHKQITKEQKAWASEMKMLYIRGDIRLNAEKGTPEFYIKKIKEMKKNNVVISLSENIPADVALLVKTITSVSKATKETGKNNIDSKKEIPFDEKESDDDDDEEMGKNVLENEDNEDINEKTTQAETETPEIDQPEPELNENNSKTTTTKETDSSKGQGAHKYILVIGLALLSMVDL